MTVVSTAFRVARGTRTSCQPEPSGSGWWNPSRGTAPTVPPLPRRLSSSDVDEGDGSICRTTLVYPRVEKPGSWAKNAPSPPTDVTQRVRLPPGPSGEALGSSVTPHDQSSHSSAEPNITGPGALPPPRSA